MFRAGHCNVISAQARIDGTDWTLFFRCRTIDGTKSELDVNKVKLEWVSDIAQASLFTHDMALSVIDMCPYLDKKAVSVGHVIDFKDKEHFQASPNRSGGNAREEVPCFV